MSKFYLSELWYKSYRKTENNAIDAQQFDHYLSQGYSVYEHYYYMQLCHVREEVLGRIYMRIPLKNFKFSDSMKKVLRRNKDTKVVIKRIEKNDELQGMYEQFAPLRFQSRYNSKISDLIEALDLKNPEIPILQSSVYLEEKLIAGSVFVVGEKAICTEVGLYKLELPKRSLGYYTMLCEIRYAIERNFEYYYVGFIHDIPTPFDYKKRVGEYELLDWLSGKWVKANTVYVPMIKEYRMAMDAIRKILDSSSKPYLELLNPEFGFGIQNPNYYPFPTLFLLLDFKGEFNLNEHHIYKTLGFDPGNGKCWFMLVQIPSVEYDCELIYYKPSPLDSRIIRVENAKEVSLNWIQDFVNNNF